ncbi:protein of unknown function [Filimonas lacunae]|uniref:DUF4349 domain-containing protein n=1 Tax=Filimonas lacunae TaxID=477680 RepID=A0A173MRG9_9BACT|nr:DUF4349 domain-containing protein [Filimonas lacunae]BAV10254.1 hypothetical protein FLA_6315 [Filimonas lacunae]SIT17791.1 protein of unknown function [Filimonas lacunae]
MNVTFKRRTKKVIIYLTIPFLVLFVFRLSYGYLVSSVERNNWVADSDFFSSIGELRKNYASEKGGKRVSAPDWADNQKYEKTATVQTRTTKFDADAAAVDSATKQFSAVIQYEQSVGNKGSRQLHLSIGVVPSAFDSFYTAIQKIGTVKEREVVKVDKTNEYRQLNAKRESLEKTLASLQELKSESGVISDFVTLHDKILEIEKELQELGVELGNFNSENEYCTVRVSLFEGSAGKKASFFTQTKNTLEWTIQYYTILIAALFGACCAATLIVHIAIKLNILKSEVQN